MRKLLFLTAIAAMGLQACNKFLDKEPFASLTPSSVFQNANDMALYANSFYVQQMPNGNDISQADNTSDYICGNNIPSIMLGSTGPNSIGGWGWTALRNINYFLDNYNSNPSIPQATRNGYAGVARFFRAYFYYGMVKTYGNVPWYSHALGTSDSSLYKPQDPRSLVVDSIVADLDSAAVWLPATKDASASTITKWVALALKSRVCLFEGCFEKYHKELNASADSYNKYLNESLDASTQIMSSGVYSLHNTGKPASDYRALFTTEAPWADEVILAYTYNNTLKIWSNLNQYFTSPTLGNRSSFTKQFVDMYLNADGSRFTDRPSYDTIFFVNEMKNRDLRLQQTMRCNGYKRLDGSSAPPDFSYTFTGYQPLKYTLDDKNLDYKSLNNNSIPIYRYAEILLNYAEAKAELNGPLSVDDWNKTIGLLRKRAGITNTDYPASADPYLLSYFNTDTNDKEGASHIAITDPAMLEIRRERGIELVMEGVRYDDIRRWALGYLMSKPYLGMYVPAMNTPYALNGDGVLNVNFVATTPPSTIPGVVNYVINTSTVKLSDGDHGLIHWLVNYDDTRAWQTKFYYSPIPTAQIVLNPKLNQPPGWQ